MSSLLENVVLKCSNKYSILGFCPLEALFLRNDLIFSPILSVVFSPFSIAITSLGEERANLSVFPLPLGVWEGLRFVIVTLPGLFSYLFCLRASIFNFWPSAILCFCLALLLIRLYFVRYFTRRFMSFFCFR